MRLTLKNLLKYLFTAIFAGVIIFYGYYQSRAIIEGPSLSIETPISGNVATTSLIEIRGSVKHAKEITINGRPVFVDTSGRFSEQLLLMSGYNIIEIAATDIEGRVKRKTIELVYKESV